MRRQVSAVTLGILLAAACGCASGKSSNADANMQTGTATASASQVDAPQSGPDAGGAATSTGISATATATGTAASATVTGTGTGTGATVTATGTGTGATATKTATATGGTGTKTTTGTGATATATGTGTGGTGSCSLPACYTDLVSSCLPSGACVEQLPNMCYANGVKVIATVDTSNPASPTSVQTYSKNGTVCYSIELPASGASSTTVTLVIKDPTGATVATYVVNRTARTITVTCTGGSPVVVSMDCFPTSDGGTPCTTGTCTP